MNLNREPIPAADLEPVPPPVRPVVLRSGGPIMSLEVLNGDGSALCRWTGDDGRLNRAVFPLASLYLCETPRIKITAGGQT